jgi:hypothetical protein
MEEGGVGQRLGAVGFEDEVAKFLLFLRQGGFLFLPAESPGDIQICLTLVAAEVQDFKGAERLARRLQLALDGDEPLARGVDAEFAEVSGDPLAPELFGHSGGCAAAAEEVGYQIAFVAAGFDNSL